MHEGTGSRHASSFSTHCRSGLSCFTASPVRSSRSRLTSHLPTAMGMSGGRSSPGTASSSTSTRTTCSSCLASRKRTRLRCAPGLRWPRRSIDGVVVDVVLDGAPARFVLDSGATHSIVRPHRATMPSLRHVLEVGGVRIAALELLPIDVGPPGIDGILGRTFFEGRRVLVDFPGQRVWVAQPSPP
jgi:hypothetical protein